MNPKMTASDAANCLGKSKAWVVSTLKERDLPFSKSSNQVYFGHETAKRLFNNTFNPQVIVFQIVKGGTGKTSLVHEFAIRASLYGAKVLCIDMDQQANLTLAFNQNAETLPVMIDILVDGHPFDDAIVEVLPGLDLLPSRFENAMLDEVLRLKKYPLQEVYRDPFQEFKNRYDLIVVDCPPSLGQSVAACALAADRVLAPVIPEKFALSGLDMAYQSIEELQENFGIDISFSVVLNKFEAKTGLSQNAMHYLLRHPKYGSKLLRNNIRFSQEFPKVIANNISVFDTIKRSIAKEDVDHLTQELLGLYSDPGSTLANALSSAINFKKSRKKKKEKEPA